LKKEIKYLIKYALRELNLDSVEARSLVYRTGMAESGYRHLAQIGMNIGSGAVGFFQNEPNSIKDTWENFAMGKRYATVLLSHGFDPDDHINSVLGSITLQIMFARLQYRRNKEPLPDIEDYIAQGKYYKKYYNTDKGKGSVEKFLKENGLC